MSTLSARNIVLTREKNGISFTLRIPELKVEPGRILAVVGGSGCGKSTLLDILALIRKPEKGELFLRGSGGQTRNLRLATQSELASLRSRELGYVLQSGGLLPFLSVRDNILLPARLLGKAVTGKELTALTDTLQISDQLDKKPQALSGGQRQRAAIARALIHGPRLVLADEPTAAVDEDLAEEICKEFRQVVSVYGTSVIVVSHDRVLMKKHADATVSFKVRKIGEKHTESTLDGYTEDESPYPHGTTRKVDL